MKTIIAMIASLMASSALADVSIATGKVGGGYDKATKQIATRLEQRGIKSTVTNLDGSDAISLAVCGGRADIGPMQIDAIYARANEGCDLKAIASYGSEYAFLMLPPRSEYDELSDLKSTDTILADTVGSGSDLWVRTAMKIENGDDGDKDDWAKATVLNDPLELAQAGADMGEVSAVIIVRKPNSPDVTRLLDMGWKFGELYDKDIDDLKFKGSPLYRGEQVEVFGGGKRHKNYVYEVRSLIVAGKSIVNGDRNTFTAISSVVNQ